MGGDSGKDSGPSSSYDTLFVGAGPINRRISTLQEKKSRMDLEEALRLCVIKFKGYGEVLGCITRQNGRNLGAGVVVVRKEEVRPLSVKHFKMSSGLQHATAWPGGFYSSCSRIPSEVSALLLQPLESGTTPNRFLSWCRLPHRFSESTVLLFPLGYINLYTTARRAQKRAPYQCLRGRSRVARRCIRRKTLRSRSQIHGLDRSPARSSNVCIALSLGRDYEYRLGVVFYHALRRDSNQR